VTAIEPSLVNLEYLERNLASAVGWGQVTLVNAAVGEVRGVTQLSGQFSDSYRTGAMVGIPVQMIPLSEVLAEPIDLLKIDVEGAELDALRGAGELLSNVARVSIEYHDYPSVSSSLPELLQLLKMSGFSAFEVDSLRRFPLTSPDLPIACCLVHGWRIDRSGNG
jgi:FkbM family methyltransferase